MDFHHRRFLSMPLENRIYPEVRWRLPIRKADDHVHTRTIRKNKDNWLQRLRIELFRRLTVAKIIAQKIQFWIRHVILPILKMENFSSLQSSLCKCEFKPRDECISYQAFYWSTHKHANEHYCFICWLHGMPFIIEQRFGLEILSFSRFHEAWIDSKVKYLAYIVAFCLLLY